MKIYRYAFPLLICLGMFSCAPTQRAYYMSPSDVRSSPYVTIPMHDDPEKTVTAASLSFGTGNANQQGRDGLIGGSGMITQSHHFGFFQAYYGAVLGMGDYSVSSASLGGMYDPNSNMDTGVYKIPSVKKFYGYYGFNGGVNVVVPFPNGKGEWRALGVDIGYRKDFGDYLNFRRSQPADKIDILAAYGHMFTIGGSTEILGRSSRDVQFGYKISAGGMILPPGSYTGISKGQKPYYFSNTLQVTKNRVTGYVQLTVGTFANVFQTGVNINLRPRTKIFAVPERRPRRIRPARNVDQPQPRRPFERRKTNRADYD